MSKKLLAVAAVLAILLVAFLIRDRARGRDPRRDEAGNAGGSVAAAARPAEAPRKPLGRYQPGARTPLPRFVPAAAGADAGLMVAGAPPRLEARGKGELRNRLPRTPPDFAAKQARVKALLDQLRAKADGCLAGWSAPDPALEKGVMLAIEIDEVGLQQVSIQDMVELPDGPLLCLADATYQLDWSGITEEPVMITVPQRYESVSR